LHVSESRFTADSLGYTRQERYVKANFWLRGAHTTVLDGFGQYEHKRPEVFLTSAPCESLKIDAIKADVQIASVSVCFLPQFFLEQLDLVPEEIPEPLRSMLVPSTPRFAFHRYHLTADMIGAARAILAAPPGVRSNPAYGRAKAVELTCLLVDHLSIACGDKALCESAPARRRTDGRLHDARELINRRYAEHITLARVAQDVGLNRRALTSGFRRLFGTSVFDYLQKERMERAYVLLQDPTCTIKEVAEAVGYAHPCNFSTAFHSYFGCPPQSLREGETEDGSPVADLPLRQGRIKPRSQTS
jgi:AraC family transcriptional regulator, transcriptional activator of the genes for pyochelin and ferripyochelin receptors